MDLTRIVGSVCIVGAGLFLTSCGSAGAQTGDTKPGQPQATPAAPVAADGHKHEPAANPDLPLAPVTFDPPVLDLGTLRPGQRAAGEVQMRNMGDKPLRVLGSRASCTCTSVNLRDVVIKPGESVAVPARFNGKTMLGEKKESIRINIEGYPQVEIPIHVIIDAPIQVVPPHIDGLSQTQGEYTVVAKDGTSFRILAVNGGAPDYVDFNPASDAPRSSYRIRWNITGYDPATCMNAAGERLRGWYLVETDNPEASVIDVEVRSQCTRRQLPAQGQNWLLSQKSMLIGRVKAGEPTEITVSMAWLRQVAPDDTITAVKSDSPDIDVELIDVQREAGLIEAKIRVTPKGSHRGELYAPISVQSARHSCPLVILGQVVD